MKLIPCTARHSEAICAILNEAIIHSTAIYDYQPRTAAMVVAWFEVKSKANFPVIGAVDEAGTLLGFASYGSFRAWPGYKYSGWRQRIPRMPQILAVVWQAMG